MSRRFKISRRDKVYAANRDGQPNGKIHDINYEDKEVTVKFLDSPVTGDSYTTFTFADFRCSAEYRSHFGGIWYLDID